MDQLAELKKILRKEMKAVGVFVDAPAESVAKLLNEDLIDLAQLHGNEDETYNSKSEKTDSETVDQSGEGQYGRRGKKAFDTVADEVLLDHGKGTGKTFDWSILKAVPDHRYFLAGGLGTENIKEAIQIYHPAVIDLSSSVETDGKKDRKKILAAVKAVRDTGKTI